MITEVISKPRRFSAYRLPIGSEFSLGKRKWKLIHMDKEHPDLMTFIETSPSPSTPDRVFNPSEIDDLYSKGVKFTVPYGTNFS